LLAHWLSGGEAAARYAGGFAGLAIGYLVKYRLDKRFVFLGTEASPTGGTPLWSEHEG
jgi:hypothetical protein